MAVLVLLNPVNVLWNKRFFQIFLRNLPPLQLDLINHLLSNHASMELQIPLHCFILLDLQEHYNQF